MAFKLICRFIYFTCIIASIECTRVRKSSTHSQDYKVEYLSVIFRHGDRTPLKLYPSDPNKHSYHSIGFGELTLEGKKREYDLGRYLRYQYKSFLTRTYDPRAVKARSTDTNRTKMSLMLVLSALYPPRGKQKWNPHLNWQPIPFSYAPKKSDILMSPHKNSVKYNEEWERVKDLDEVKAEIKKFDPLMKNLTRWTGTEVKTILDVFDIYHTLMAEHSMGLELPMWASNIFLHGHMLRDATILHYHISSYNIKLRRLFGGMVLKNIIDNMSGIANKTINDGRKIQLFSGHEANIASILSTLGVFRPHVPEYSSCVIVELLQNQRGEYHVGILYYLGIPSELKVLQIPGCDMTPCPLEKFLHLMKDLIPTDEEINLIDHKNNYS